MAVPTRDGGQLTVTPLTTSPHSSVSPDLARGRYLINIEDAQAPGSYDFRLDMPDGAHAVQNQQGGVDIIGASGESIQTIDAPWAKDANGADLPTRFDIVDGPDGTTVLRQHVAFDENTAYPVLADPATEAAPAGETNSEPAPSAPAEPQDESTTAHGGGNSGDQPGPEASRSTTDDSTTPPSNPTNPAPAPNHTPTDSNNDQTTDSSNGANTDTDHTTSGSTDTGTGTAGDPEPVTTPAPTPTPEPGNPAPTPTAEPGSPAPPAPGTTTPAAPPTSGGPVPAPPGTGTPIGPTPPPPSPGPEPVPTGPVTDLDPTAPGVQTELPTGPTHPDLTPATTRGPGPEGPTASEIGHTALDIIGLAPGLGEVADGINALWYLAEGDYLNAGLSAAAMLPGLGTAATAGKWLNKGAHAAHTITTTTRALPPGRAPPTALPPGNPRRANFTVDTNGTVTPTNHPRLDSGPQATGSPATATTPGTRSPGTNPAGTPGGRDTPSTTTPQRDSVAAESASEVISGTNARGLVNSRGSFRKATLQDAWDNAKVGPDGGRLCPTCGGEVSVPPNTGAPRDWDGSHFPSWTNREFPSTITRSEVLDNYNRGVSLECPICNRSAGNNDARFSP